MSDGRNIDTVSLTLGEHGARLVALESTATEIKNDVKTILAAVQTQHGENKQRKRTWVSAAGLVGAAAGITELIEFVKHMGKH